jgi:hypothetical protein
MEPFVALMRRYVNDYTNRHDVSVCAEIMAPDYTLRMGPHVLAGRDEHYIPASRKQFAQFPGLCLTVHEIVTDGDRLAMRFSEHGRSVHHDGRAAVWGGLGLYRWDGAVLVENYVEQDYLARRRQLATGVPATVEPPALAPWDTEAVAADPEAEAVVRAWLDDPGGVTVDGDADALLAQPSAQVDDLFSAGPHVAFRVTRTGTYAGGLEEVDAAVVGSPATLHLVGLVSVADGRVGGGRIVVDRLGLVRSLAMVAS